MSKVIITGIENGKISYIEGEEINTSVEELREKVYELREKISRAKALEGKTLQAEHLHTLSQIEEDFVAKLEALETEKAKALEEENSRYFEQANNQITQEEILALEKEEAKLSLLLESFSNSPEFGQSSGLEESVEEVPGTENLSGVVEEAGIDEPLTDTFVKESIDEIPATQTAVYEERPKRIIF